MPLAIGLLERYGQRTVRLIEENAASLVETAKKVHPFKFENPSFGPNLEMGILDTLANRHVDKHTYISGIGGAVLDNKFTRFIRQFEFQDGTPGNLDNVTDAIALLTTGGEGLQRGAEIVDATIRGKVAARLNAHEAEMAAKGWGATPFDIPEGDIKGYTKNLEYWRKTNGEAELIDPAGEISEEYMARHRCTRSYNPIPTMA